MPLPVSRHALGAPAHPSRFHAPRVTSVHIDKRAKQNPAKVAAASKRMLWVHRRTPCQIAAAYNYSLHPCKQHPAQRLSPTVTVISVSYEYLGSFNVHAALTAHRSPLIGQCSDRYRCTRYRCNSKPQVLVTGTIGTGKLPLCISLNRVPVYRVSRKIKFAKQAFDRKISKSNDYVVPSTITPSGYSSRLSRTTHVPAELAS